MSYLKTREELCKELINASH